MEEKRQFVSFIGIDPGLSGAVAVIDNEGRALLIADLPTCRQGGFIKRRVDSFALADLIRAHAPQSFVAIELVGARAGQGALSGASLASSMAACEGVCAGLGAAHVMRLPPAIWKAGMGLIGTGKQGSVSRAKDLTDKTLRHDQAEAYLLARFAWLQRDKPLAQIAADDQPQTQPRAKAPAPRQHPEPSPHKGQRSKQGRRKSREGLSRKDAPEDVGAFVVGAETEA